MRVDIIMRSRNDRKLIVNTLRELKKQIGLDFDLYCFDNESTDGTLEIIRQYTNNIYTVAKTEYIPGKVLNKAMSVCNNEIVVFLNSDCTPTHNTWLLELCLKFNDSNVGAVYSKQIAKKECFVLEEQDLSRAFEQKQENYHFFSMAASAIRRVVWEETPFREDLRYSEDVAFSYEVMKKKWTIAFAPFSMVEHSHNYSAFEWYRRQMGEGQAEASIFEWSLWRKSLFRYSVLPYFQMIKRDVSLCIDNSDYSTLIYSPYYRMAQVVGRRIGFVKGLRSN